MLERRLSGKKHAAFHELYLKIPSFLKLLGKAENSYFFLNRLYKYDKIWRV